MKKITKIISFCAAVTMAATAVPASSLLMAKAADAGAITIGSGSKDEPITVTAGEGLLEIPLYMQAPGDTEGISFAFVSKGKGAATKALLNAATYESYDASDPFVNLGSWEENPKGLSWGIAKAASPDAIVKASDVSPDEPFFTIYYTMPDEKTVKECAEENGLERLKKDGKEYYDFPLEMDRVSKNNKKGKLFAWGGPNGARYEESAVIGNTAIRVYVTPDNPDVTTTTATTTTTAQTTTTTVTTTTTEKPDENGPELNINHGDDIFVEPAQMAEIPLYMKNPADTNGLSFGFELDKATQALLTTNAYEGYDASDLFTSLGMWEENPKGLSWGIAGSKDVVNGSDIPTDESIFSLFYNIPDKDAVQTIADNNGLALKTGTYNGQMVEYYEFPLTFDMERLNNKKGHIVAWAGANNTRVNANYVSSNLCVVMNVIDGACNQAQRR